jgi:hypothetical protein
MPSDQKRLDQVFRHIEYIKAGDYPVIVGHDESYRIVERPWKELAEPSKLAILQDAVDWTGITNRDQATILLSEIDLGRITDAQRTQLIDAATSTYEDRLRKAAAGGMERQKDRGIER